MNIKKKKSVLPQSAKGSAKGLSESIKIPELKNTIKRYEDTKGEKHEPVSPKKICLHVCYLNYCFKAHESYDVQFLRISISQF